MGTFGDTFAQGLGQKFDQFWHWVGDQLGFNPNYGKVDPRQIDTTNYNQDRANQNDLMAMYKAQAAGTGPSLAQGLLQQATDQNISQAMALGAAQQGQGLGYASALRNIADQSAAARQQSASQAALLKNQEMLQGQNQLGGLLSGMAGQDLGLAGQQAQLGLNYDVLNQQAQMANRDRLGNIIGGLGQGFSSLAGMGQKSPGMAQGGMVGGYADGGAVDSPAHDTVPIMATPGEEMVPLSIMSHPNAPELAAHFTAATKAGESPEEAKRSAFSAADFTSEMRGGNEPVGPGAHLAKMEMLEKRISALEGKKRKAA